MKNIPANRLAAYAVALAGLLTAISVPLANLDTTSVAGVIAGLTAIVAAFLAWLKGWRDHEARGSVNG